MTVIEYMQKSGFDVKSIKPLLEKDKQIPLFLTINFCQRIKRR